MTFEEFFLKKKIDREALKLADPALHEEFRTHYAEMGSKSFDHTKKFLFNKLRHLYPLKEIAKTENPNTEKSAYKPMFKK